jgi:alkanesulfonate monooxygenase SsuD/methylene tetrahydromethanopterin reductase-like flavin-dependent oxidoreductase (luciferase family)
MLTDATAHRRRAFLGTELVDAVDRHPCQIEDDDSPEGPRVDLARMARLARTAERGGIDYLIVDDTLAGNPPFSGRRRSALEALHLAARLATAAQGVAVAPRVHSAWVEPSRLLDALVGLDLASPGPMAWQLDMPDSGPSAAHGPELLAAIVQDAWGERQPKTGLAAMARAQRARRLREGQATRSAAQQPAHDAGPLLLVRACNGDSVRLGARHADLVRVEAGAPGLAGAQRQALRAEAERCGRDPAQLYVVADITICLNSVEAHAAERAELIETITGHRLGGTGARYIGSPDGLVEALAAWLAAGACDGFTFLPSSLPIDLVLVVDLVLPELRRRGVIQPGAISVNRTACPRATAGAPPRTVGVSGE